MLSYPDRRRFEQIRARWEAAERGGDNNPTGVDMVGRKEKQALQESGSSEPLQKFRRKLSHGLAFISNPLSQRKSVSGRQLASNASLAVVAPNTNEAERSPLQDCAPETSIESQTPRAAPAALDTLSQCEDPDKTPKPLPRSRTVSYIPRPVRSFSGSSTGETVIIRQSPATAELKVHTPSRIPSPSLSTRRVSSPRQYLSTQQLKDTNTTQSFAVSINGSPSKKSVRSHTMSNLMEVASSSQTDFAAPRRSGLRRPHATSGQSSMLQENLPTCKRADQKPSHVQNAVLKRESLSVPKAVLNRRSLGPGALMAQGKQHEMSIKPAVSKRFSLQTEAQSSAVGKHTRPNDLTSAGSTLKDNSLSQTRLAVSNKIATPIVPSSAVKVQNNSWRASCGSQLSTAATHQVRRLPQSSTFHNFGRSWEAVPSLPQISEQLGSSSVSDFTQTPVAERENPFADKSQTVSNYPMCDKSPKRRGYGSKPRTLGVSNDAQQPVRIAASDDKSTTLLLSAAADPSSDSDTSSKQLVLTDTLVKRDWPISNHRASYRANFDIYAQVKHQMPAPWWAGRFQARFDQWRTAAMSTQLTPGYKQEISGPLGRYSLEEEKLAAAYILRQLRDLCTTDQAADSLWTFEYRYRKDNQLLTNSIEIQQRSVSHKQEEQPNHKGAFGRAVRKITPRKASFVNLLKGRGWSKDDDFKSESMHELWASIDTFPAASDSKEF